MANNKARLFVGGLKREVEKDEMESVFSPFGELVDTWIAYDPPGFAFVEFKTNEEAAAAMSELHKSNNFGSEIRVEVTKPRGWGGEKKESENKPRLFVGDIKESIEKEQLSAAFEKFGSIADIWVAHNPPGFAFVEYYKMEDAEEAIKEMHEKDLFGGKIRVQLTKTRKPDRSTRFQNDRDYDRGPPRRRAAPYDRYDRRPPPSFYDDYYDEPYRRPAPRSRYARDPYARDAAYAPLPRRPPPRDPYARDPYYADAYDDPYAREPLPRRAPARRPYPADSYYDEPRRPASDPYERGYAPAASAYEKDPYAT